MDSKTVKEAIAKFEQAKSRFIEEIKKLRTGRAHPSMVEGVTALVYGTQMPLIQLATITTPEPQLIQISPFDPSNLPAISQAIRDNQSLGLNPSDDGHVIRLNIPPLTTERRAQIAKQLGEKVEESLIAMRNVRHDARSEIEKAEKDKEIGRDDVARLEKQIDEAMAKAKADIETAAKAKEQEILTL
ncbi:MAG: ribosome recycling factor [bacterium]|nr:ribosome recycling factor [bacterium]